MYSSDEDDSPAELITYDISNDEYYKPHKHIRLKSKHYQGKFDTPQYGSSTIRHSIPAYDLWLWFYPTFVGDDYFRNFHRPKLKHYNIGPQKIPFNKRIKPTPVKNLTRTIYRHQKKLRCRVIKAINDGYSRDEIINQHHLIRNAKDLTAKHGELFLFEYSEEFPPVLSQNGMCSNVKTLIRSQSNTTNSRISQKQKNNSETTSNDSFQMKDNVSNFNEIGVEKIITNSNTTKQIYYNQLTPGSKIQVIENNLYRAPIFPQKTPSTDFLIIRTRNSLYIRSIDNIFVVGQTMPLVTVPQPKENSIQKFRLGLSNRYIEKLFMESSTEPPSINIDHLAKLFKNYYEKCTLIKRLQSKGAIMNGNRIYRGSSDYGLKPLNEIRSKFTPEQYCLIMAMLAGRQRLRDLNYTESMINQTNHAEVETEVLTAPWNTSSAVTRAHSGKNYLDFKNHLIDPTGPAREGFSCITWPRSPTEDQQIKENRSERSSSTPDSINNNGSALNSTKQTQPVMMKNPLADKMRREKLERLAIYQREAQIIFEMQSRVLSSREELSSEEDNEDSDDEENLMNASFDEQSRDLSKLITENHTFSQLTFEKEEEERHKMIKEFNGRNKVSQAKQTLPLHGDDDLINVEPYKNKILKITRRNKIDGIHVESDEIIREPKVIALYVKNKPKPKRSQSFSCSRPDNGDMDGVGELNKTISNFYETNKRICLESPVSRLDGSILIIKKSVLNQPKKRAQRRSCQQ